MKEKMFANSKNKGALITKKKKKAFTLIELLAIIVILAIIAVITVPIILNIIENSKKGAAIDSAYGYKDAVNKWYVSKLTEDSNFKLNNIYTVQDGRINGAEISISGDKPSSGYLNYSNNVLTEGCLTIGDYKVTFENGSVSSTIKGECDTTVETVLYYTYDYDAVANEMGFKISEKVTTPNTSWKTYIKETKTVGVSSYVFETMLDGKNILGNQSFYTLEECENSANLNRPIFGENLQCKEIDYTIENEVYGVENIGEENQTVFSLKPNDWANTINTLNTVFPGCGADSSNSGARCDSSSLRAAVDPTYGIITIIDGRSPYCRIWGGFAFCSC